MKLGLLTDIHERHDHLKAALERFRKEQVDQVVVLGDVFRTGDALVETCRLLTEAGAIGVWGNHDRGLCVEPEAALRTRFPPESLAFMATLRPRLDIACCYVSHVEPWLNPEDVGDLWYLGGAPDSLDRLPRIFSAVPHRVIFAGHYHHWFAATEDEILDWHGEQPLQLRANRRYFLVIGALCEGRSATFETDTSLLQPFQDEFPSTDTHVPSADAVSTALDLLGREVRRPE